MTRKYIDHVLIGIGLILMVASFWVFSTGKRKGDDFRNIVAQIKFLKNTVQTKMAGSVAWFTGEEEEKINAYGLGLTGVGSTARYLYLNKFQIISLDDSLIEFLPTEELQVNKGKFMVLNPDGALKIADKNGLSQVVKPGMLYETTEKGLISTPTTWRKSWIPEGEPYSVELKDNVLTEYFLLAPPMLAIDRFGTSCLGKLQPIEGDTGDVSYQIRADGRDLTLNKMEVQLPAKKAVIEVRSVADSVSSVWREVALPSHCITEGEVLPTENLAFWSEANQTFFVANDEAKYPITAYFMINSEGKFEVTGPGMSREAMLNGDFKKEYLLPPGTYHFILTRENQILDKTINVKVKPFKIKNSIFIEE